jgi:hypothetical protein
MSNRYMIMTTVLAAALVLGGCAATEESESKGDPAAKVEAVDGSDVSKITLSELGARRLAIATQPVQQGPAGKGLVIPFSAVVYDVDGTTWTFANPTALSYIREPITISAIDGDRALLSSGPAVGTAVVTVGAAELIGAEAELGA